MLYYLDSASLNKNETRISSSAPPIKYNRVLIWHIWDLSNLKLGEIFQNGNTSSSLWRLLKIERFWRQNLMYFGSAELVDLALSFLLSTFYYSSNIGCAMYCNVLYFCSTIIINNYVIRNNYNILINDSYIVYNKSVFKKSF